MKALLKEYDLGRSVFCSVVCTDSTDAKLRNRGLRTIRYHDGQAVISDAAKSYTVQENNRAFFESLNEYDVVEISEGGVVRSVLDTASGDAVLFITSKCNSNCLMCPSGNYSRKTGNIPSLPYFMEMVRYYPSDLEHITITGGEPFLIGKDAFALLQYLKRHIGEAEYLILTNGRIFCLDHYVSQLAETAPVHTTLAIPLHGSTAASHDRITQSKGSFDQTISGISKLLAADMAIEIRIVVSKLNVHDLENIAKLIAEKFPNTYRVHLIGLEMLGNAAVNHKDVWLPYEEAFAQSKAAIDLLVNAGISTALYNFPLCAVEEEYHLLCKKSISDYKQQYPEACLVCAKRELCGGIFAGSKRFAEKDLKPFIEESND